LDREEEFGLFPVPAKKSQFLYELRRPRVRHPSGPRRADLHASAAENALAPICRYAAFPHSHHLLGTDLFALPATDAQVFPALRGNAQRSPVPVGEISGNFKRASLVQMWLSFQYFTYETSEGSGLFEVLVVGPSRCYRDRVRGKRMLAPNAAPAKGLKPASSTIPLSSRRASS